MILLESYFAQEFIVIIIIIIVSDISIISIVIIIVIINIVMVNYWLDMVLMMP